MLISNSKLREGAAFTCLALMFVLGGCANQQLHNDGMDLVHEGHVEEGLQKLDQASKAAPDNLPYRNDYLRTRNQSTYSLLAAASNEQSQGNLEPAKQLYGRVLKIDPENRSAKRALETVAMAERHGVILEQARTLIEKGDLEEARGVIRPILVENPRNGAAGTMIREIDEQEAKTQAAEPVLTGKFRKPISLQFRDANIKMVFEALSRISGINVLLDKDVKGDTKTSIFVNDVSVADAIDLILMQAQLEKKILSNNTLYIYPNTTAKIKELKELKVRSFHLTYADPKNMMNLIKALLKTKDIFVHEKTSSIIMRDTPEAIHLAEKLVADQDIADPEVMLEVEVLEVTRARLRDLGLQYPSKMTFTGLPNTVTAAATGITPAVSALTLGSLKTINSDSITVTPTPAVTLNLMLQDSDTNILSSPRLRVKNREKAKIMIGERVPIITNSVTPVANGGTPVVTGTVSYQDVGLKFDVEPEIHLDNEVTIKLGLEVSSLGQAVTNSSSGSLVYTVGTRNTSTSLRLHDGETQILAGLITDNDTSTVDKIPLLGQIPLLGHLFSNDNSNKTKTEIILSITPHIVGNKKIPDAREMEYWSGTDSMLRSDQLVLKPLGEVSLTGTGPNATAVPPPTAVPPSTAGLAPTTVPRPSYLPPAMGAASSPAAASSVSAVSPSAGTNLPAGPAAIPVPSGQVPALLPAKPAQTQAASSVSEAHPAAEAATSLITFSWTGPAQAKVGDKISLALNAQATQGVKALHFNVGFDPSVFKALDVTEGDAMKHNNASVNLSKIIDQTGGDIMIDVKGSGSSGGGGVVALTFEVIAPAEGTTITANSISATMENGEAQTPAEPAPFSITAE